MTVAGMKKFLAWRWQNGTLQAKAVRRGSVGGWGRVRWTYRTVNLDIPRSSRGHRVEADAKRIGGQTLALLEARMAGWCEVREGRVEESEDNGARVAAGEEDDDVRGRIQCRSKTMGARERKRMKSERFVVAREDVVDHVESDGHEQRGDVSSLFTVLAEVDTQEREEENRMQAVIIEDDGTSESGGRRKKRCVRRSFRTQQIEKILGPSESDECPEVEKRHKHKRWTTKEKKVKPRAREGPAGKKLDLRRSNFVSFSSFYLSSPTRSCCTVPSVSSISPSSLPLPPPLPLPPSYPRCFC